MSEGAIPTGFTPCLDPLLQEYGPVGACVFGRVWRYAQMSKGVCEASHDTIAGGLNITRRTAWRWIKILCDDGYLEDLTPSVTNHPHKYRITAKISTVIEMHSTDTQCDRNAQHGVIEMHSHCVKGSHEERETSSKKQDQESGEAPSAEPDPPKPVIPSTFQEWQTAIRDSSNRQAVIRRMIDVLYPGLDPPGYGYIVRTAKKVGGWGRLAELLWQHATRPPTGNLLAYIQAVAKGKDRDNGRTERKTVPRLEITGWEDCVVEPVPEPIDGQ